MFSTEKCDDMILILQYIVTIFFSANFTNLISTMINLIVTITVAQQVANAMLQAIFVQTINVTISLKTVSWSFLLLLLLFTNLNIMIQTVAYIKNIKI